MRPLLRITLVVLLVWMLFAHFAHSIVPMPFFALGRHWQMFNGNIPWILFIVLVVFALRTGPGARWRRTAWRRGSRCGWRGANRDWREDDGPQTDAHIDRLMAGLDKMERRMDNLETIFDVDKAQSRSGQPQGAK